jgi:Luciferase-like monooxygenase
VADKATGRYADPARIHAISHRGRHFTVAGPLNVERPPQGYPLLVQAGSSEDGKDFAARHAEAIFTAHQNYERASAFYADVKKRARASGRNPDSVIVLPGIVPYIGSTEEEARALARQFDDLRVPEYGLLTLSRVFELEPGDFELDAPLPDSVLARPGLEGSQSRSDLIIEMAVRENLMVRQIQEYDVQAAGGDRRAQLNEDRPQVNLDREVVTGPAAGHDRHRDRPGEPVAAVTVEECLQHAGIGRLVGGRREDGDVSGGDLCGQPGQLGIGRVEQARRVLAEVNHRVGAGCRGHSCGFRVRQSGGQGSGNREGDAMGPRRRLRIAGYHGHAHDIDLPCWSWYHGPFGSEGLHDTATSVWLPKRSDIPLLSAESRYYRLTY